MNNGKFFLAAFLAISIVVVVYTVGTTDLAYAQSPGLRIAPTIQWDDNKEGHFNYCIYKGTVKTGTNVDNQKRYCLLPQEDSSLVNMYAHLNDGVVYYHLDEIVVPPNMIRDGQEYTVCVGFNPQSGADYSIAEKCQTFRNTPGSHVETLIVNLNRDACYDCDY
jgi:hypothetical protein